MFALCSRIFRAKCSGCLQQIIPPNQLVMRALDHVFHIQCFACVACGHPLQKGDEFAVRHGQLLCRLDFEKEMAMMPYSPKSKRTSRRGYLPHWLKITNSRQWLFHLSVHGDIGATLKILPKSFGSNHW